MNSFAHLSMSNLKVWDKRRLTDKNGFHTLI